MEAVRVAAFPTRFRIMRFLKERGKATLIQIMAEVHRGSGAVNQHLILLTHHNLIGKEGREYKLTPFGERVLQAITALSD